MQAQTLAQADELSLEVCEIFLCPFSRVLFWFSTVLFLFWFCLFLSAPLYFYHLTGLPFLFVGFVGYFLNSYVVCLAVNDFAPCVGFVA